MAVAALSTKNPYYISRELDWVMMRDAYGGERHVKEKSELYLPPTLAQAMDGLQFSQPGRDAYQAYKQRAVYHELVKPSLMAMLGVMHRKPPDIQLPATLEPMRERATFSGENLAWLIQKINEQQMLMGRYGLFLDVESNAPASVLPYIVGYNAESMINWDSSKVGDDKGLRNLQLVVINETDFERRAGLAWTQVMRYRVLAMAGDVRDVWDTDALDNEYIGAEVRQTQDATAEDFIKPSIAGKALNAIPFVFVGPRDLAPEPDAPVLMPMARLALAIYRTEADYRQALYMQGQDTLVIIGQQASADSSRTKMGAFGAIELPVNGDAKFIGVDSKGLAELANCVQNDLKRGAQLGAQLLTERGNEAESGEALNIRVASRTATLTTVAQAGAAGLERILKYAAMWKGADPTQVKVSPNLDFADDPAQAQDLVYWMTAKNLGLPVSERSMHAWLKRREFTVLDYEAEKRQIDEEGPRLVPPSAGARGVGGQPFGALPPRAAFGTK